MSTIRATLLVAASALIAVACASSATSGFVPSSGSSGGGEPTEAGVQAALDRLVASGVPGGVVLVDSPDSRLAVTSGRADASGTPMTVESGFALGGVATTYVATVLLQMADEGLIDLGNSVEDHLPGLLEYGWDVAIFDLLQHIAGVPDYYDVGPTPGTVLSSCATEGNCDWTAEAAVALIAEQDSDFQPGEGWAWSNSNYRVAEMIISEITGTDWDDEVNARLLGPLGLEATTTPADWSAVENLARGHADTDGDGEIEDLTDLLPYGAGANGAMASTAGDLVAFLGPLLQGDLLSEAADVALFAAAPTGFGAEEYGHGILFPAGEEGPISAAAGEALGYSIYVEHNRDTATTTAILLNQSGGINPNLWGNLVLSATPRERCDVADRGTTVPGGLRLYCSEAPVEPGQSIQ